MADNRSSSETLSKEERAAVRERAKELKNQANRDEMAKAHEESIAALTGNDRQLAEQLRAMVAKAAPGLLPRTYYGMPAWANADGKVVCFMQPASKFKVRYATFGFETAAQLDDGDMWPTSFALNRLSGDDEATLSALVAKAAG